MLIIIRTLRFSFKIVLKYLKVFILSYLELIIIIIITYL